MLNDRLTSLIGRYSKRTREARQVSHRLKGLLPLRFREVKTEHTDGEIKGAKADRRALADPRYVEYLEELVNIRSEAHLARVQYETHTMLFQARQSLRRFVR